MNLVELTASIKEQNANWWIDIETGEPLLRNKGELVALIHSELSECLEGIRKGLMDDHLPHRSMEEVELADTYIRILDYIGGFNLDIEALLDEVRKRDLAKIPGSNKGEHIAMLHLKLSEFYFTQDNTLLVELISYIELYALKYNLNVWAAMQEKLEYNRKRADHKLSERRKEHGKKF